MKNNVLFIFILLSCGGWSAEDFLYKDVHVPSSEEHTASLEFCTHRALDNGSLKSSLLEKLKHMLGAEVLVESGTYLGGTAIRGAAIFPEVHTIELSPELYSNALQRFEAHENVTVHYGDSSLVLPEILPLIESRILFYLDGHYSGPVTARGSIDTPLLGELQAIAEAEIDDAILLIDDIRLFQASRFPEKVRSLDLGLESYPDLEEVLRAILNINPLYQFCFLGDALLVFPENLGVSVSPVMRSCALHRLEKYIADLTVMDLEEADRLVSEVKGQEKEEISLYYHAYSPSDLECGYLCYGAFWQALILWNQGDLQQSESLLQKTVNQSLPNWSADRLLSKRHN